MKLTPPDDTRINNVRLLCSIAFSVVCWVFVRTSFLRNPKEALDIYRLPKVVYLSKTALPGVNLKVE